MSSSMFKSAWVVAASTIASRVLGFARDVIIASLFGASSSLDGFFIAFRIPNFLRRLVAEGALSISFIPVYTEYLELHTKKESLHLAQKMFTLTAAVLLMLTIAGFIFSPHIVRVFAAGFTDVEALAATTRLSRIMMPYLFLIGLVAFSMGFLNSHKQFFSSSFSPVLLNVGFILGAILISRFFKDPMSGLAVGVITGGILQLALQFPYLVNNGFALKLDFNWNHPGIKKILHLLGPYLLTTSVYQMNILVNTMLASFLPGGSISYLYYSDRLTEIVIGIFVMSIGSVLLPEISVLAARKEFKELNHLVKRSVRAALFMALPASVALVVAGFPVVSTLFMRGEFSANDASLTAKALLCASIGITSITYVKMITPVFYAMKNIRVPFISTVIAFVVNIAAGLILMRTSLSHAGLALANSIAVSAQLIFLVKASAGLQGLNVSRDGFGFWFIKILSASSIMGATVYALSLCVDWIADPFCKRAIILSVMVTFGIAVYAFVCFLFRVKETEYILRIVRKAREKFFWGASS